MVTIQDLPYRCASASPCSLREQPLRCGGDVRVLTRTIPPSLWMWHNPNLGAVLRSACSSRTRGLPEYAYLTSQANKSFDSVFAPAPSTTRGAPTVMSVDAKVAPATVT